MSNQAISNLDKRKLHPCQNCKHCHFTARGLDYRHTCTLHHTAATFRCLDHVDVRVASVVMEA